MLTRVLPRDLYARSPNLGEGPSPRARPKLVNRRPLADEARRLALGTHLALSHGEETTGGRDRPSALADAYEALLGAVFLDGGFEAARTFILRRFLDGFGAITELPYLENPKGDLQEMLQAESAEAPRYDLTAVSGPDHDRVFECAVYHGGAELGRGSGKSKKAAESAAALAALTLLREKKERNGANVVPASDHAASEAGNSDPATSPPSAS